MIINALRTLFVFSFLILLPATTFAQTTDNDGDWANFTDVLMNTPEGELMARTGDIDNLGFGWPTNFDPFSGNNTPTHSFPWPVPELDPEGTDRVMVITSYDGNPPAGQDGYTGRTSRPDNEVQSVVVTFPVESIGSINAARLQIFADDFQAPVWQASYEVRLDSIRVPEFEAIFNNLSQTGPIGRIVSINIPPTLLYLLNDGSLTINIDDFTTGAGDGFALDFIKLVINPSDISLTGTIMGIVTDQSTGNGIADVRVVANGQAEALTDSTGAYQIEDAPTGLVNIQTFRAGYGNASQSIQLGADQTATVNFQLQSPAPTITAITPAPGSIGVDTLETISVSFSTEMDTTTMSSASFILSDSVTTIAGSFSKTTTSFTFIPDAPLPQGMTYRATLTSAVADVNGIALEQDSSWVFSTQPMSNVATERETPTHSFTLSPGFPNPFSGTTTFTYHLTRAGAVDVRVYNILGHQERVLMQAHQAPGEYRLQWDGTAQNGRDSASGLYFIRVQFDDGVQVQRVLLLK